MTHYMSRPVTPVQPIYTSTNHLLHLILSFVTLGLWLWVWPIVAIVNSHQNKARREQYQREMAEFAHNCEMYEAYREGDTYGR